MEFTERSEVLDIADGLGPEEIMRRARQAADAADEVRARYGSVLDMDKRCDRVLRALVWESVVTYMEDTGATTFSSKDYLAWNKPGLLRRWLGWTDWVNPFFWASGLCQLLGTGPRKRDLPQDGNGDVSNA